MEYTLSDIEESMPREYRARGRAYFAQSRVQGFVFVGERLLDGVNGSDFYRQIISVGNYGIEGECSCPVGYNCKHVAAFCLRRWKKFL